VIGAGLAGSLLALALARRGASVRLVGLLPQGAPPAASFLSYGAVLGRRANRHWRQLERIHGPLGWRRRRLLLQGWPPPLDRCPPSLLALLTAPLPFAQVDGAVLAAMLPRALAAAGVECRGALVNRLEPASGGGWQLWLEGGAAAGTGAPQPLATGRVVLAAGAGCRALWPALPQRLRCSWAGVLALGRNPGGLAWLEQVAQGRIVLPRIWQRADLERRAQDLTAEEWIVDGGAAPWGEGVLVGQISLVRPGVEVGAPPDPERMESRLREQLALLDPPLATLAGPYRQVPVPFCTDGRPLVGPLPQAPGLWAFTGFSGAFSLVPSLAEGLAERLVDPAARPDHGEHDPVTQP
jgi:glycine/D-amino acid oxidase-like deaminating enzyme